MSESCRILYLADDPEEAILIRSRLEQEGIECSVTLIDSPEAYAGHIAECKVDLILADYSLPSFDGLSALAMARAKCPDVPFIFVSGMIGEDLAVETFKNGATDYILKGHLSRLAPAIRRALKEVKDRGQHRRSEEALQQAHARTESILASVDETYILFDRQWRYVYVNDASVRAIGRPREELLGRTLWDVYPDIIGTELEQRYRSAMEERVPVSFEFHYSPADTWWENRFYPAAEGLAVFASNITERKRAQQERELTIEFLRLVNESTGTRDLIRAATAFFQQQSRCEAVGIRLKEGEDYPYFETRGFPKEFVLAENSLCARDSANCIVRDSQGRAVIECMCGNVICGRFDPAQPFFTKKGSFWSNNTTELLRRTTEADRQARTRNRCNGSGYESVALIPLRVGEERLGLLQLNDRRPGVFSEENIGIWERLADQLAVALAKFRNEELLRESEKKYKDLFDSSLDGIYRTNAEGVFIHMNPGGAWIFGYNSPDEIVGKNALDFWRDQKDRDAYVADLKKQKKLSAYPIRARKRTGEPLELESSSRIIEDDNGSFLGIEGILRDVTERRQAEEELRSSVLMWNNTFDAMNDAIAIMDADGAIVRRNRAMARLMDEYPEQTADHPCWHAIRQTPDRIADCPFLRMKKSLRRESAAIAVSSRWFNITADPIFDQMGWLIGGVHIMTDITEQRLFDERLRESENKFRSLAEQSLVGAYIIQNGIFQYVNPRLAEMFAYRAEDIVDHKGPLDLVVPEDHHLVVENMKRRLSGEVSSSHYEARGRKRTGQIINIEIFGSATAYQGRPAVIGVVLDTTEKKKLEGQLLHAQKMEAVGQLTSGIAHDFNNILSAIIGYGSLLQMKLAQDDPLRAFADQILAGADRAANLTRSLLTFSRRQAANLVPVDINGIIGRVDRLLHRVIGEDIDLRLALAPGELVVKADVGQIEQVLINLATNARDAMPKGGILSIETSIAVAGEAFAIQSTGGESENYVLVSVSDTGIGMDEKIRERIFEPFFTTKDLGRGTGLGLSMVYGIIQQHGGHIHCYSEPGRGTTFKLYLPLANAGTEKEAPKTGAAAPEGWAQGKGTILVAEDDEALRRLATVTLEHAGYTVIGAVDGADAVGKFLQNRDKVRLVLCDVIMPKRSGGEVREAIEQSAPGVKFVFMSGYPADIVYQKGLVAEGAEIILKPIPPVVLLRKVREVLGA